MNEYLLQELQEKAQFYRDRGEWLHAAQLYYRILSQMPERLETYFDLATMYANMEYARASEHILLQALSLHKNHTDVLFALGVTTFRSKQYERSLQYFEQLIPEKYPKVHYYVGSIAAMKDDLQGAERHFQIALTYDSSYKSAYHALCDVYLRSGAYAALIETAANGVMEFPEDWKLMLYSGLGYIQMKRPEDALPRIRKAVELNPNEPALLRAAADAVAETPYIGEAETLLFKAMQLDPTSADVLVSLGMVAVKRSDRNKAIEYFSKALELDPDNDIAIERMQLFAPGDRRNA